MRGSGLDHHDPDPEALHLAEKALQGADRLDRAVYVGYHYGHRKPPKRLRLRPEAPKPEPEKMPWSKRILVGILGFFAWVTAPLDWLTDWISFDRLFRGRRQRYRDRRLKGGWQSTAGRLMSSNFGAGPRVLLKGADALHLVQLTPPTADACWSAPLEEFRGIEVAHWDDVLEKEATLRCHFTDGSWADVVAHGPGWREFTEKLPRVE